MGQSPSFLKPNSLNSKGGNPLASDILATHPLGLGFDHTAYPHILDAIILYASRDFTTSLSLRATCHYVRERIDSIRARHLMSYGDDFKSSLGGLHPATSPASGPPKLPPWWHYGRWEPLLLRHVPQVIQVPSRKPLMVEAIDHIVVDDDERVYPAPSAFLYDFTSFETVRWWTNGCALREWREYPVQNTVSIFFDWCPPPLTPDHAVHDESVAPSPRPRQTAKTVFNLDLTRAPTIYGWSWGIKARWRPELVVIFHQPPPRPGINYRPAHATLSAALEKLVRMCEEGRENMMLWRPRVSKITFVNGGTLPDPRPASAILEIRYLTLDEYRAEVGDQQFYLESDDTYTLPAKLRPRLRDRAVSAGEASGSEM
jgi:hypothetical protein